MKASAGLNPDAGEIRRALSLICTPGAVYELRAPDTTNATISGYFNDLEALANAAVWANHPNREAPGVYLTINPAQSDLLARSANAVRTYAKHTTSDADISRRGWLLLDLDPRRPSGIAATDEEHRAALELARTVRDFLLKRAWPAPLHIDSGNGAYLLYRIDLANDNATRDLIKRVLEALAALFDDEHVSVDRTMFNAARIARIPGTVNRKGDSIVDRQHRLARILEVPFTIEVVAQEQLVDVAALLPEPERVAMGKARTGETFDLERWILDHGIEVARELTWLDGRRWILRHCLFDPSHGGSGAAILKLSNGAIAYKCQHNSCADKKWSDVREKFEPGYRDRPDLKLDAVDPQKPTKQLPQADELVYIARQYGKLFHDCDATYAAIARGSHHEVWPLRSRGFKNWLAHSYFTQIRKTPNGEAIANALTTLEGLARFEGPEHCVSVRLAERNGKIYLDLANDYWQAVEVDASGWRIVDPSRCGVYFRRPRGMLALPLPEPQMGTQALTTFEQFLNVGDSAPLVTSWLVAALRPTGPYPAIAFHGEQGSAKSSTQRYLRATIDPNQAPMHVAPKDVRDLQIAAHNGWVVSFDNLSHIPPWLSDCLCRLATGGGFSSRELYTDSEEIVLDAMRPVVLNGIEELTTRADLLDRTIVIELEAIPESARRPERSLDREFNEMRPAVLGALLNAVARALRDLAGVQLSSPPRMADFATWVTAAEPALPWQTGVFLALYRENIASANTLALEASVIFPMLEDVMPFEDTATELLNKFKKQLPDGKKPEGFPGNARALSGTLKRIAPNLRRIGIDIGWTREPDKSRTRKLTMKRSDPKKSRDSASAASSGNKWGPQTQESSPPEDGRKANAASFQPNDFASAEKPQKSKDYSDGLDASDANSTKIGEHLSGLQPNRDDDGGVTARNGWNREIEDIREYPSGDHKDDLNAVQEAEIDRLARADAGPPRSSRR